MTPARSNWIAIWAVFLGGVVGAAHIGKAPPALPDLRTALGLSLLESGFIATTFNLLGAGTGLFAGVFSDRIGHRRAMLAGLATMIGGGLAGLSATAFLGVLLGRFLEGAGFMLCTVSGVALMTQVTTLADRPRAMGLWSAYMPTGGALAMLAAPLALSTIGWRGLWALVALATALCAVVVWRYVPAPPARTRMSMLQLARESLAQRGSLLLCAAFLGYAAQWASVMVWLPTFAIDERGASLGLAALLTAGMIAVNAPGNLLGGPLMSRGVRRSTLIVSASLIQALSAAGIFLDVLPDSGRYLSCLAFSFFGGLLPVAVMAGTAVHAKTPAHIGTTNGMVMQVSQIGQFFGPILVAWLATRQGWSASLGPMLAFAAVSCVAGIAIGRLEAASPSLRPAG